MSRALGLPAAAGGAVPRRHRRAAGPDGGDRHLPRQRRAHLPPAHDPCSSRTGSSFEDYPAAQTPLFHLMMAALGQARGLRALEAAPAQRGHLLRARCSCSSGCSLRRGLDAAPAVALVAAVRALSPTSSARPSRCSPTTWRSCSGCWRWTARPLRRRARRCGDFAPGLRRHGARRCSRASRSPGWRWWRPSFVLRAPWPLGRKARRRGRGAPLALAAARGARGGLGRPRAAGRRPGLVRALHRPARASAATRSRCAPSASRWRCSASTPRRCFGPRLARAPAARRARGAAAHAAPRSLSPTARDVAAPAAGRVRAWAPARAAGGCRCRGRAAAAGLAAAVQADPAAGVGGDAGWLWKALRRACPRCSARPWSSGRWCPVGALALALLARRAGWALAAGGLLRGLPRDRAARGARLPEVLRPLRAAGGGAARAAAATCAGAGDYAGVAVARRWPSWPTRSASRTSALPTGRSRTRASRSGRSPAASPARRRPGRAGS